MKNNSVTCSYKLLKLKKELLVSTSWFFWNVVLDNVVYRLGLATTRRQARQFVNHGHILVDGKRVDIPSYRVTPGQVISVREKSAKVPAILEAVEATVGRPAFVSFDADKLEGSLTRLPERDEINPEINEALVVEFYNKML